MNARAERFPLFDGLRALAALSVLAFHATLGGYNGLPTPIRQWFAHGDVGVSIFFVISGFLLYRPFVRARFAGEPAPRVGPYAARRLLRIVPAYWVALTIVALWLDRPQVFHGSGIATYYGFAQVYSANTATGGIGQAWTLCVEMAFYAFLPAWALLGARRSLRFELLALALLFAAGSAFLIWAVAGMHRNATPVWETLPAFLDQFALGMALAAWSARGGRLPRALERHPSAGWVVAIAASVAVVALDVAPLGPVTGHARVLADHELYSLLAVALVAPAVLFPEGRGVAGRVLGNRTMLTLGLWSYGIYLYHVAVITKLLRPVTDAMPAGVGWRLAGLGVASLVVTSAIAALSYRIVERPALALKRYFPLTTPAARGEALAEPVTSPR